MHHLLHLLHLLALAGVPSAGSSRVFNVLHYGARGDGLTNDTAAIRSALASAGASGGGVVLLPAPHSFLSGPLHMKNHTVFRVEEGAVLLGSTLYTDYRHEWVPGGRGPDSWQRQSLIAGAECTAPGQDGKGCSSWAPLYNVTLDGGGIIDGQGHAWWWASDAGSPAAHERPDMVQPAMVHGLVMRDLTFRASPNWSIHPLLCTDVLAERIVIESGQFDSDQQYQGHNVDGFDPDSCENVILRDSVIRAGDDCVAIYSVRAPTANILIENVSCHTPLSITHGAWGTSNVTMRDCTVHGDWGGDRTYKPRWWKTALRIKSDRHTNGTLQNIAYHNIRGVGVDLLFDIQMWYPCQNQSGMANYHTCRSFYPVKAGVRPHIRNVSLVNVTGDESTWRTGWLNCLPESPCQEISITDVRAPNAHGWVCENVHGHATGANMPAVDACFSGDEGGAAKTTSSLDLDLLSAHPNSNALKTDDSVGIAASNTTVGIFRTWEVQLPAPPGFTASAASYNSSQLNATAQITNPGGEIVLVRGFFMVPIDDLTHPAAFAPPVVAFRYTPVRVGLHSVVIMINGGAPSNHEFRCSAAPMMAAGRSDGFVRVGRNKQHFVVDQGLGSGNRTYFGVGENLAWQDGAASTDIDDHLWEPYLSNLSRSGANYIRVWLTDSWTDLYVEDALGNYSQPNSHKIDKLLRLAEANNIRVLMCTESFNLFCSRPKPAPCSWDTCVYNAKNGGMLSSAADFFTDPGAKALYKQRLQYLVSRFSHSTAVFAWEFFNEVDITDGFTPGRLAVWTVEMARYLRSIDPYSHPISTSFCCQDPAEIWALPEVDFVMTHSYSTHNRTDMADNSQYWTVRNSAAFGKPVYVAETGEATIDDHRWPADPTGLGLHNAMWASVVSVAAMSSMTCVLATLVLSHAPQLAHRIVSAVILCGATQALILLR